MTDHAHTKTLALRHAARAYVAWLEKERLGENERTELLEVALLRLGTAIQAS